MQNFSSQYDISITQIKNNMFRSIEHGNWWKLDSFYADLIIALKRNDATFVEKVSNSGNLDYLTKILF